MKNEFSPIEAALEGLAGGGIVIVVDSEDREDEGDFLVAGEFATPEAIHFLISRGRGQLCMPVLPEVAQRLAMKPMVIVENGEQPRFAVPLDHCECQSGTSPVDRSVTIQAIVDPDSRPEDFLRPGHIFPLIAEPNGVLSRTGHTEATVDLCRHAGLSGAGVLCEICSSDGLHMAGHAELFAIAAEFDLPVVSIDDLIEFRKQTPGERTVSDSTAPQQNLRSIGTPL